jgi:2-polyprenyl-3-methyl-5-hydroxy-6-metoxy-1,4-benzoquinol methylase
MTQSNIHTSHHGKDDSGRSKVIEGYIIEVLRYIDSKVGLYEKSILDVGCDYGFLMKHSIDTYKSSAKGLEPNNNFNPFNLNIDFVDLKTYHDTNAGIEVYDVIIINHVLEHFHNPYEALKYIKDFCIPGTKLFVAVPHLIGDWAYWEGHYSLWDNRFLSKVLKETNFNLVDMQNICFRDDCVEIWSLSEVTDG